MSGSILSSTAAAAGSAGAAASTASAIAQNGTSALGSSGAELGIDIPDSTTVGGSEAAEFQTTDAPDLAQARAALEGEAVDVLVTRARGRRRGLLVADIGSDWYFQGDSNNGWNGMAPDGQDTLIDEISGDFHQLKGSDFEVVYTGDPVSTGL